MEKSTKKLPAVFVRFVECDKHQFFIKEEERYDYALKKHLYNMQR